MGGEQEKAVSECVCVCVHNTKIKYIHIDYN